MPEADEIPCHWPEETDPELELINIQPITLDDICAGQQNGDDR